MPWNSFQQMTYKYQAQTLQISHKDRRQTHLKFVMTLFWDFYRCDPFQVCLGQGQEKIICYNWYCWWDHNNSNDAMNEICCAVAGTLTNEQQLQPRKTRPIIYLTLFQTKRVKNTAKEKTTRKMNKSIIIQIKHWHCVPSQHLGRKYVIIISAFNDSHLMLAIVLVPSGRWKTTTLPILVKKVLWSILSLLILARRCWCWTCSLLTTHSHRTPTPTVDPDHQTHHLVAHEPSSPQPILLKPHHQPTRHNCHCPDMSSFLPSPLPETSSPWWEILEERTIGRQELGHASHTNTQSQQWT